MPAGQLSRAAAGHSSSPPSQHAPALGQLHTVNCGLLGGSGVAQTPPVKRPADGLKPLRQVHASTHRPGLKKGFAGPRQCARVASAVRHDTLLHLLCTYQMSPLPSSCSAVAHRIPFSWRLELVDKTHTHTYIYINRAGDFATDVHSPHDRISKRGLSHVQLMRLGEPASQVFHSRFNYEMAPFTCGDVN